MTEQLGSGGVIASSRDMLRRFWPAYLAPAVPGLGLAIIVALAATYLAEAHGAPVMLLALLMGMVMHSVADTDLSAPGTKLAASLLLRIGVALLGLRITAGQIAELGWQTGAYVIAGVILTIGVGIALARLGKMSPGFGIILGGASAICGASAALAISSVMRDYKGKEAETVFVVAVVTTLSTLAMVFYPVLPALFGLDDHEAGILFGATIHDVAQVVGAGYAVSEEAGDTATIVKLFRVVLLVPVVLIVGLFAGSGGEGRRLPLPPFVIVFAALVVVNSLVSLPASITVPLDTLSRWCLVAAVAALGMRTSLAGLVRMGARPLLAGVAATLVLLGFVLVGLMSPLI